MNAIEKNLMELIPLAINQKKFSQKTHRAQIESSLAAIQNHLVHAGTHLQVHSPAQKTVRTVLQSHLDDAHRSYSQGHHEYARKMVLATVELCTRCHTQDSKGRSYSLNNQSLAKLPLNERAKFLMGTRRYREAKKLFEKVFQQKPDNKPVLRDLVQIQFRLGTSPQKIANYLDTFPIEKKSLLGSDVIDWKKRLRQIRPNFFSQTALKQLEKAIEKNMTVFQNPKTEIDALYLQYLLSENHAQLANIGAASRLYKMAIIDQALNQSAFFSPSLNYLETCIEGYPKQKYAAKCLERYTDLVKNSFTGSAGIDLPKEIKQKIDHFKGVIQKAK